MKHTKETVMQKPGDVGWSAIQTCTHCRNHYVVVWLRQADNWNDFGYRHCPFCGWAFDETTGAIVV